MDLPECWLKSEDNYKALTWEKKIKIIQWVRKPDCKNDTETKTRNNLLIACWNSNIMHQFIRRAKKSIFSSGHVAK